MEYKQLADTGIKLSSIGLGAMPLSLDGRPSEADAFKIIHRTLDLGINLIDTADSYCIDENDKHHNERLISRALKAYKGDFGGAVSSVDDIVVATKGGLLRPNGDWVVYNEPNHLRKTIKESYEALGGQSPIKLWQLHAYDQKYPLESTIEVIKEAVNDGYIKHVGLSNFSVPQIEKARKILPIVSIQNQFNPWHRNPEKDGVLEYCERNNLIFFSWSPVGGSRRHKRLVEFKPLTDFAQSKSCTAYSIVLAWLRHKSPCVVPIPGASKITSIEDSVSSLKVKLSQDEMKLLDNLFAQL